MDEYILKPLSDIELLNLKNIYYVGAKVRLVKMDDAYAPKKGSIGTVISIDCFGTIKVRWSDGRVLNVLNNIDVICKL